jgi:hypothetical protein
MSLEGQYSPVIMNQLMQISWEVERSTEAPYWPSPLLRSESLSPILRLCLRMGDGALTDLHGTFQGVLSQAGQSLGIAWAAPIGLTAAGLLRSSLREAAVGENAPDQLFR